MEWSPGGMSNDVEDRRSEGGGGGFNFGGGGLGIVGVLILLGLSLFTGRNYLGSALNGGGSSAPHRSTQPDGETIGQSDTQPGLQSGSQPGPRANDRDAQLVSFVLDDVQKTWSNAFAARGKTYPHAKLVLYRGVTYSGCGRAQAQTGPFYCPQDQKVYIDLSFWNDLKRLGGDTGDFAQAYVIAHELGHHVQNLLGIESRMNRLSQQDPEERNALSVDLELQADCLAGVWAHSAQERNIVHPDDIPGALRAAAVGDDHLQRMSGRAVSPESWTHGSSAQRDSWLRKGIEGGTVGTCKTFNGSLTP